MSVNLQVPDEAGQASFCVTISKREKVGGQPIISYMMYLIMVDMSFSLNFNNFFLASAKFKCEILFQGISDTTNMVIHHAVTIEKSEKKKFLYSVSHFHLQPEWF